MSDKQGSVMKTNRWLYAIYIGFFAGFIWGALKIVEQYFKFTKITIGFLVEPFFRHDFLLTWQGMLIGWGFFALFSIVAAFLYMVTLWKQDGPWWGIAYGFVWWCVLYLLIGPTTGMVYWMKDQDLNSILSDFCLFLVWGLFIGYSITVEYNDEREREPIHKT